MVDYHLKKLVGVPYSEVLKRKPRGPKGRWEELMWEIEDDLNELAYQKGFRQNTSSTDQEIDVIGNSKAGHPVSLMTLIGNGSRCRIEYDVGEFDVSLHDQWQMHHGEQVTFNYSAPPVSKDGYFWLPVECRCLCEIRSELGLSELPKYPFHLTVGII